MRASIAPAAARREAAGAAIGSVAADYFCPFLLPSLLPVNEPLDVEPSRDDNDSPFVESGLPVDGGVS